MTITKDFEEFLEEKHAEQYHGLDDDMPDDFANWLGELDGEDFIAYAQEWGDSLTKRPQQ